VKFSLNCYKLYQELQHSEAFGFLMFLGILLGSGPNNEKKDITKVFTCIVLSS